MNIRAAIIAAAAVLAGTACAAYGPYDTNRDGWTTDAECAAAGGHFVETDAPFSAGLYGGGVIKMRTCVVKE